MIRLPDKYRLKLSNEHKDSVERVRRSGAGQADVKVKKCGRMGITNESGAPGFCYAHDASASSAPLLHSTQEKA